MKKVNIFWFIIDSVRTFRSGIDDRDRLDIMDELAEESVEFVNCVTSAPSSLLSAGAIFTGLPGVFIARHFNDWKFNNSEISTIKTLVEHHGYKSYPILDNRELRERLQYLLPPLRKIDLPSEFRLSDYAWHNSQITKIFKHILNGHKKEISCYTLWYDCRRDPLTNRHVKEAINEIKKQGLFENSIIIMHSDHGYPDPRTKLNEKYFRDIGHDMVLTDDNVKVPFLIKYPACPKNIKIEKQIGLVDVIPTIFDLLGTEYKNVNTCYQGKSIIPIVNKEENIWRTRRTDTRLPMDKNRMASLRNNFFKYIFFYNDNSEVLFDLKQDPSETNNCIENTDERIIREFRDEIKKYEDELYSFHKRELETNINNLIKSVIKDNQSNKEIKILIASDAEPSLIQILIDLLKKDDLIIVDLMSTNSRNEILLNADNIIILKSFDEAVGNSNNKKHNCIIYLTENSKRVFIKKHYINNLKKLKADNLVMLNFNFEQFDYLHSRFFNTAFFKLFFDWEIKGYFYKQEPLYFLRDLGFFIKGFFQRAMLLLRKKDADFDLNAAKEAFEFRKYHIENNEDDLITMSTEQLNYEIKRVHTKE